MTRRGKSMICLTLCLAVSIGAQIACASPGQAPAAEVVLGLRAKGIMVGDPDGDLRWSHSVTRSEAAKMLITGMGTVQDDGVHRAVPQFGDVGADHWARGYLSLAAERGLVVGYPDGTCRPESAVTRGEYVAMVVRMWLALGGGYKPGSSGAQGQVRDWIGDEIDKADAIRDLTRAYGSPETYEDEMNRADAGALLFAVLDRAGVIFDLSGLVAGTEEGTVTVNLGSQVRSIAIVGPVVRDGGEIPLSAVPVGRDISIILDGVGRSALAVVE